jgi:hypothetical protein
MSAKNKPFRVTLAQVQAAGKGRTYPTLSQVNRQDDTAVTTNADGQISSAAMTARYVERFCTQNNLKR